MTEEERPGHGPDGRTDDEVWEALVASFHASPDALPEPAEGLESEQEPPAAAAQPPELGSETPPGWRTHSPPPEPEEHFVPPTPPPGPPLDTVSRLAWAGTLGGPALLLAATLFGWDPPQWLVTAAVVGFLGGFVTLVARMRSAGDPDDRDDGAVV